jgi:PelA/Pel-15E family pectate lyase
MNTIILKEHLIMNKNIILSRHITFLLMLYFIPSINNAQPLTNTKKHKAIDISYFMDSAHHWYDIYGEEKVVNALPNKPRYKPEEITKIADNILLFQKVNGGWPKNYDMLAILTDKQKEAVKKSIADTNTTTFDNGTTHSQVEYLSKVYTATHEEKYKVGCLKGIDFILSAQYSNGGWPQFYPHMEGYSKYITFNDGAMMGIMEVLQHILQNNQGYSFVDKTRREKVLAAFNKGLECILKCQVKENGILYSWCQQHDNVDFRPQWARAFEPPSICNDESVEIVKFLMNLDNPSPEIIKSIQSAVKWFNDSKILGIKVKVISAPTVKYKWRTSSTDRIVEKYPNAPPIWTRYYELITHKPLFCNRDSKPVYSLSEVDRERRDGYRWYVYTPKEVLDIYPEWQRKWAPDQNVLSK